MTWALPTVYGIKPLLVTNEERFGIHLSLIDEVSYLKNVINPYKEEGTRPHIIISGRQVSKSTEAIKILDVYSKVFDKTPKDHFDKIVEEYNKPTINLKLKEDNTVKLVTKRIEYNISTSGDTCDLSGSAEPWKLNLDAGSINFGDEYLGTFIKSDITLKLK